MLALPAPPSQRRSPAMRDAKNVVDDCMAVYPRGAVHVIEADRRSAKLECLREAYDRCFKEEHMVGALNAVQAMIAELESGKV